jgi:hypothetical protein
LISPKFQFLSIQAFFSQNALNSNFGKPSTVIPAKSKKLAGIRRTLFSKAMFPAKEIFSDEFKLLEIRKKKKKLASFHRNPARFRRDFTGITVDGSPESLLRAF